MNQIKTIHEVRSVINEIDEVLTTVNAHIIDNSIDTADLDNLRKAWNLCRNIRASKWTNQVL